MVITLLVAAVAAVVDWWAVWSARAKLEAVAKPLVMIGLLGWALGTEADGAVKAWVVAAVIFSLLGDLFLLPSIDRFELGLGSFLIAHLGYVGAAIATGLSSRTAFVSGAIGAVVAALAIGWPIWQSLSTSRLRWPVAGYIAVITAMLIALARTAIPMAYVGALIFAGSDTLLAQTRFVRKRDDLRWLVHMLYHLGQALLVVGLIRSSTSI